MNDFDIFRWLYKNADDQFGAGSGLTYHCKSRIAIAYADVLHDTFWMRHGGMRGGNYGPICRGATVLRLDQIEIQFLANLCDLEEIYPEDARDFPEGTVVDLRHSNNSLAPVLVPKGATKSVNAMVKNLNAEIRSIECEIQSANWRLERKRKELTDLVTTIVSEVQA